MQVTTFPQSMTAYVIDRFGAPEVFRPVQTGLPPLRADQVIVKVASTSVNPLDWKLRAGFNEAFRSMVPRFPAVLHGDLAGVITQVGEDVPDFAPGDEVYACYGGVGGDNGALADYVVVDYRSLARKPRTLGLEEAGALPLAAITAWNMVMDRSGIRSGHDVLVYGGTGGVGHLALQLARLRGARVYATVGDEAKAAVAASLGAVPVYHRAESVEDFTARLTEGRGFDVVLDTVGGEVLEKAFKAVKTYGRVVTIMPMGKITLDDAYVKAATLEVVLMLIPLFQKRGLEAHGEILTKTAEWIDAGKIRPLIDGKRFRFADIAAAHRYAESGRAVGKVLVTRS